MIINLSRSYLCCIIMMPWKMNAESSNKCPIHSLKISKPPLRPFEWSNRKWRVWLGVKESWTIMNHVSRVFLFIRRHRQCARGEQLCGGYSFSLCQQTENVFRELPKKKKKKVFRWKGLCCSSGTLSAWQYSLFTCERLRMCVRCVKQFPHTKKCWSYWFLK